VREHSCEALYWEDWEIGARIRESRAHVTKRSIVAFGGLSAISSAAVDEEYCKSSLFGSRFAHGP